MTTPSHKPHEQGEERIKKPQKGSNLVRASPRPGQLEERKREIKKIKTKYDGHTQHRQQIEHLLGLFQEADGHETTPRRRSMAAGHLLYRREWLSSQGRSLRGVYCVLRQPEQ